MKRIVWLRIYVSLLVQVSISSFPYNSSCHKGEVAYWCAIKTGIRVANAQELPAVGGEWEVWFG